jgi:hypothetical protein
MACFQKLPQSAYRGPEVIEFAYRKAILVIGAFEIRKLLEEFSNDLRLHRSVDPRDHTDVAGIETHLPLVRRRDEAGVLLRNAPLTWSRFFALRSRKNVRITT